MRTRHTFPWALLLSVLAHALVILLPLPREVDRPGQTLLIGSSAGRGETTPAVPFSGGRSLLVVLLPSGGAQGVAEPQAEPKKGLPSTPSSPVTTSPPVETISLPAASSAQASPFNLPTPVDESGSGGAPGPSPSGQNGTVEKEGGASGARETGLEGLGGGHLPPGGDLPVSPAGNPSPSGAFIAAPLYAPLPTYPLLARKEGWEGEVVLAALITPEGLVQAIEVLSSSGYAVLDRAAQEALAQWRYPPLPSPDRSNRRQVVRLVFRLEGNSTF